jgi:hypothetical protein
MPIEHAGWAQRVAGWIFRGAPAVLLGILLCSFTVGPGFREDEISCEEAVAHLDDCCPGFDETRLNCTYDTDCAGAKPDLEVTESRCIREASCDEIRARNLCALGPVYIDGSRSVDVSAACP